MSFSKKITCFALNNGNIEFFVSVAEDKLATFERPFQFDEEKVEWLSQRSYYFKNEDDLYEYEGVDFKKGYSKKFYDLQHNQAGIIHFESNTTIQKGKEALSVKDKDSTVVHLNFHDYWDNETEIEVEGECIVIGI
jgi:hypothetical protein